MNLVKAQIPRVGLESYPINLFFVWRQLGFAFFGALASVGALFYLCDRKEGLYEKVWMLIFDHWSLRVARWTYYK
jgi:hypothetical protein